MKKEDEFKPFVPADKKLPELTIPAIILGILIAVLFGAANAYLGLRVGMTISASIPAAVISMGIMRIILKRTSILENNIVQTIGSAGESISAGAIFTIPALFMWQGNKVSLINITLIALCGGILGVIFMVPLRKALIVKERNKLPYPEGTACAEVLMAGEKGGKGTSTVFIGLGLSAFYKFITSGIKLFPEQIHLEFSKYKGSGFGCDVLPALLGVGYICGSRISSYLFAGGTLGWLIIMPLISFFGGNDVVSPGSVPISEMSSFDIWTNYIKYIGAGAVACGGIISLIKTLPVIGNTLKKTFSSIKDTPNIASQERIERDISIKVIAITVVLLLLVIWLVPAVPVNFTGALMIIIFSFLFATVSSRLVGLVGSSNNPVSGMAIATLLISAVILKSTGIMGEEGMISAIAIGSVICIVGAVAGDTSQDLKTGNILGSTPKKQQIGEFIGVIVSALAVGGILYLFNSAWGYGSTELPAPQATLMKTIVEGVMGENLPWTFVLIGVFIAIVMEILQIPVLAISVGLYLPIHLSVPIMIGGVIRWFVEKKNEKNDVQEAKESINKGVLYSSGLIAGEGLVGIILAILAIIPVANGNLEDIIDLSKFCNLGTIGSIIFFVLLCFSLVSFTTRKNK